MKKAVKLLCPNKNKHSKARDGILIVESQCSALLLFVDQSTNGVVFCKCRNCKSIIKVETIDTVTFLEVLDADHNLSIDVLGKVVIK